MQEEGRGKKTWDGRGGKWFSSESDGPVSFLSCSPSFTSFVSVLGLDAYDRQAENAQTQHTKMLYFLVWSCFDLI